MESQGHNAVEVRITGRVQGVWFRGWTREQAQRLGLGGWVRNAPDGSVQAMFTGTEDAMTEMLSLCHRGPPAARVVRVETRPAGPAPEMARFAVIR